MTRAILFLLSVLFSWLFFCAPLAAQQLPLQVLSPAGSHASTTGFDIAWTFGEPLTFTYPQSATLLTQGFHQPEIKVVAISETQAPAIRLYPNPTQQLVYLEKAAGASYTLYTLHGQLLLSGVLEEKTAIDLSPFAAAPYLLRVLWREKEYGYSLIKTN